MKEILENFNDQNVQSTFSREEVQKNNVLVAVCYFIPLLFFVPVLVDGNSPYCRFHANQQLTWFIFDIIVGIAMRILSIIPVLGAIVNVLVSLGILAFTICLMYGAIKGMAVKIPFIGGMINIF